MEDETTELVKENMRLTRENNRLLRKLWRAQVLNFWSKVFFFAILVGVPVLVYQYYLSDVLKEVQQTYQGVIEDVGSLKDIPGRLSISTVIESLEERRDELLP